MQRTNKAITLLIVTFVMGTITHTAQHNKPQLRVLVPVAIATIALTMQPLWKLADAYGVHESCPLEKKAIKKSFMVCRPHKTDPKQFINIVDPNKYKHFMTEEPTQERAIQRAIACKQTDNQEKRTNAWRTFGKTAAICFPLACVGTGILIHYSR